MKNRIIFLIIISVIAFSIVFFLFINRCEKINVDEKELVGTYVMNYKQFTDTLIINNNYTFYHSSYDHNTKQYIRNGKWHATVEGYYELLNYSSATMHNSWDMKPYKCKKSNIVYIEESYDGEVKYKKIY